MLLGAKKSNYFCDSLIITHKDAWQSGHNPPCNFKLTKRWSHFNPREKYFKDLNIP
jgi:hypothetical protein